MEPEINRDDVILRSNSCRQDANPFVIPDSDSNDDPNSNLLDEMAPKTARHSTSSSSGDNKAKAEPREALGKLVYRHVRILYTAY